MEIHGDNLKWKRGENDFFILSRAKSTLKLTTLTLQGGQFHLLNNYEDHLIFLEATTSLSQGKSKLVNSLYIRKS